MVTDAADRRNHPDKQQGRNDLSDHRFGGPWTEIKLRAVADYLAFYTRALQAKPSAANPFKTWYIDAFAGTGDRTVLQETGGVITGRPHAFERRQLDGSARRALKVDPPFEHLVFIEKDPVRFAALDRLRLEAGHRDLRCLNGDANEELVNLVSSPPWSGRGDAWLQRGVVFLDPYGMAVQWKTLRALAQSERLDVWYLFPLHAVLRQLAHDRSALDQGKYAALTEVFGTEDWEAEFYKKQEQETGLFGDLFTPPPSRQANPDSVEAYARSRLATLFPYVSEAIPILSRHKLRQFSLFCVSGNPSPVAINLIKHGVAAQLKKYGASAAHRPASRPRSGP